MAKGRMLLNRISVSNKMENLSCDGARLLYTWMLSHLDKNGCFYANPKRVNKLVLTCLNHTDKEVEKWIKEMNELGCIKLYQVNGDTYLFYPDFLEKQPSLHQDRESNSGIPEFTPDQLQTNSRPTPDQLQTNSGNTPPYDKISKDKLREVNTYVELYNSTCINLSKVEKISESRAKKIRVRLKEEPDMAKWKKVFQLCNDTPFLRGESRDGWRASFDWVVENDKNYLKVLEGKYMKPQEEMENADTFHR